MYKNAHLQNLTAGPKLDMEERVKAGQGEEGGGRRRKN